MQPLQFVMRIQISIHAPAKGATENTFMVYDDSIISIHAPAKGATIYGKWGRVDLADFNPRSREGSDCPLDGPTLVGQISIHAPAKGATSTVPDDYPQYCVFQSTLPRRERQISICSHQPFQHFNPRSREGSDGNADIRGSNRRNISIHAPAKGATTAVRRYRYTTGNFNPRSREGSDYVRVRVSGAGPISIHAPAKGATRL